MSSVSVSAGQSVTQGQKVGTMGATGNAAGVHLHFAIKTGSQGMFGGASGAIDNNKDVLNYTYTGGSGSSVNLGADFYAYLINTSTWLHVYNETNGNVTARTLTKQEGRVVWHFTRQSDGSYKIASCKDGKVMEVLNFGSANGTNVVMNTWTGNTAQRWFISGESATYTLRASCGSNVLDLSGGVESAVSGTNMNMWIPNGTAAQLFQVWKLTPPTLPSITPTVSSTSDSEGNNVLVSWTGNSNCTGYDVKAWDSNGNCAAIKWNAQGTSCKLSVPAGTYKFEIAALSEPFGTYNIGPQVTYTVTNAKTPISSATVSLASSSYTYSGSAIQPGVTVTLGAKTLTKGIDYTVAYRDNARCGTATVTVTGIGNYAGTVTKNFTISHNYTSRITKAATCAETGVKTYTCGCGDSYTETIAKSNIHGAIEIRNAKEAQVGVQGYTGDTYCTVCQTKLQSGSVIPALDPGENPVDNSGENPVDNSGENTAEKKDIKTVQLAKTSYTYNGRPIEPTVTVYDQDYNKVPSTGYKIMYSNNVNVGKATVTITGTGNYEGSITKTFTINPKGTTISSLKKASNAFTVKWKKQAAQTTGYQIRYSLKSSMAGSKTVTVGKTRTVSTKIKKLKAKKKYYVQIRTYKTVNGTKYYSAWSAKKSVKTK